ncbi:MULTISPECIES: Crp/Fnr family transcriptional regulator [Bacillaceae]|uniref:Crp/Fnr family transcriptional regulator n=1 Tax=Evansella alkalicola TaxID=745819 RepID=A0ABS6K279_9BACI|nr:MULTISPECIES: Crp/Fnr family transcriptional regulator [Bacillaceae]MBU9723735.1 Crp/Fnr family transcriptional regulator [Bacillus alkalicola]
MENNEHRCESSGTHSCEHTSYQLCVSKVPIFNHLKYEELLEVVNASQQRLYDKGEHIYQAGDLLGSLYIVHKGKVKIYRLTESGKEQLIRFMEPGDFMGELSIFSNDVSSSFAEAVEKTEICMISKSDIMKLLESKPAIGMKVLEEFSRRLRDTEKTVERLSTQDAEKRLASYLLELAEGQIGEGIKGEDIQVSSIRVVLPMRKKDLASYIGITQETLSRRLSGFQEMGVVELVGQREIIIVDYDALVDMVE